MDLSQIIYWDSSYNAVFLINLAIAIAIFASLRFLSAAISHVNPTKELLQKDNPAFGISLAAVVFAVTIIITGAIYGDPIYALGDSVIAVGLYGAIGLVLMMFSRLIFDKMALPKISIKDEIIKGNVAAATIDASNLIATAIIIRTMMVWVESNTVNGLITVLLGFLISQILLSATTYIRGKKIITKNDGTPVQKEIEGGNIALALRFAGHKIGTAFAVAAASNVLVFESYDMALLLPAWFIVSIIMIVILTILIFITDKLIFPGVDAEKEVVSQKNVAVGVIQGVTYISMGLLLAELMA